MKLCKACHGGCCRRYKPYLWGSDIIRICNALGVDINFFTAVVNIDDEKYEELKGKEPILTFTDAGEPMNFVLVLKYNESKFFPDTPKCIFLQEWSADALGSEELKGIIGRCGIYDIRPINCRAWPASYNEEKKQVVIRDPNLILDKIHRRASDSPAYNTCPRPLEHEDYAIFEEGYSSDAITNYHEKQFFIKVADKWNQNPDVSDKFYDFLVKAYSKRIEHIKEQKND